ncbi:MAG TPA: hypothetical protein VE999_14600 [Gemmataceae bacterium]|nr:hypothetical protein [Gemmataceae bacterium]
MFDPLDRRRFVTRSLQAGAIAALGDFSFLHGLPAPAADNDKPARRLVPLQAELEPLVRLIEDTPRGQLMERIVDEVHKGTSYEQLLSAVFLAGVRGIQPRPVGFKFHAVLVINSAHLASLRAPDKERWLPLFWAIDNFKSSQMANQEQGDWRMDPVQESKLPPPHRARERFIEAMDDWDEEGADRAITTLARTASSEQVYELFWRYGCRDFRDIGHKAIYAANSWRTLQAIGWRHGEPVVRSLAYAMLDRGGNDNPAEHDYDADRPYRENQKRVADIGPLWKQRRRVSPEAAADLLETLRTASPSDASTKVVELLKKGIHPSSIWDGLLLTAGELIMRQPGIVGIHCITSANALHFGYQTTASDETRRLLMLQTAAFLSMFRQAMGSQGKLAGVKIDRLEKAELTGDPRQCVEEIFATVSKDRMLAARKTLSLMDGDSRRFPSVVTAAERLIFSKGNDSHDYKFSSAALEDYYYVTPPWRARYAAASMFNLKGAGDRDNNLIERTRAALAKT